MALLLTMFVEILVLVIGLWLLLRTTTASLEFPHIASEEH